MIRLLPYAIQLALVVFCLVDCVQADERRIRNLPKWAWVALIILLPIIGCITWLLGGRPKRARAANGGRPAKTGGFASPQPPTRRPKAPDDDPEFLRSLKKNNADNEKLQRKWEDEKKRREEELKAEDEKKPDEA